VNGDRQNHTGHSQHAEMAALYKLNMKKCRKQMNLIVIRVSKTGVLGESRPCSNCIKQMHHSRLKFKYIIYSNKDGILVKELFKDMHASKSFISSGFRIRR
jgi:cytidine deaminase